MTIRLDAIGIVTKDLLASLRFYRLLGVPVADPAPGEDHVEAQLPNGLRLMWDTIELVRRLHPEWHEPVGQRMGLAFLCVSAAEVDQVYGLVREAGYTGAREPWDAFWGQRYAQVMDADGNLVDLFAPL